MQLMLQTCGHRDLVNASPSSLLTIVFDESLPQVMLVDMWTKQPGGHRFPQGFPVRTKQGSPYSRRTFRGSRRAAWWPIMFERGLPQLCPPDGTAESRRQTKHPKRPQLRVSRAAFPPVSSCRPETSVLANRLTDRRHTFTILPTSGMVCASAKTAYGVVGKPLRRTKAVLKKYSRVLRARQPSVVEDPSFRWFGPLSGRSPSHVLFFVPANEVAGFIRTDAVSPL